jgi:hypothetical protein
MLQSNDSKLRYKQLLKLAQDSDGSNSEAADDPGEATPKTSKFEQASARRNLQRIESRARIDKKNLGKYLPDSVDKFLLGTLMGPGDTFEAPVWLFQAILAVANEPVPVPDKPPVQLDTTDESILHDSALLREFDSDNGKVRAYFFAIRPCEFVKTPQLGRTKRAKLGTIIFWDKAKVIVCHSDPLLLSQAKFITVVFVDQKNGTKMDHRTQRRTDHAFLCPVPQFGRAIMCIIATVPNWSAKTPLCMLHGAKQNLLITSIFTKNLLRHTCYLYGGIKTFGFHPQDIRN